MTLTLDLQGQILKMLHLRNGRADWHGTKGMWVDRILDSHCDFEPWPHSWPWHRIFKANFLNSCISGTGGQINMERKGYESIGCYTVPSMWPWAMTLTLDFEGQISKREGRLTWEWKRCELDTMLDAQLACFWATVHGKYIGQVMGRCETVTVSNLLAHEWAVHSLI